MVFKKLKRVRKNCFGSTKNFITWLILLMVALVLLNSYSNNVSGPKKVHINNNNNNNNNNSNIVRMFQGKKPQNNKIKVGGSCDPSADKCPTGSISYLIKSGSGTAQMPIVCFNGEYIIDSEKNNAKRGFNVVIVNDKTLEIEDVRTFDTYESDSMFKRYLRLGIPDTFVILITSFDDASYNLTPESKMLLSRYGSKLIDNLNFRDNFVMLGQKTLLQGQSIEKISSRALSTDFAPEIEIKGCAKLPIGLFGDIGIPQTFSQNDLGDEKFQMGAGLINCGVPEPCDEASFSVHMYTGLQSKDMSKLCINGKYIFAKDLNNAGRGLNVAVVSPKTKDVIRLAHFDTFASSSSMAELFMEMLDEKDIVIAVAHDEASTNLNVYLQRQFESLGSSMISKLSFRDAWVFVGQKGINGKSPIEELSQTKSDWPNPIDKRLCVPINLSGITAKNVFDKRSAKKKFCSEHKDLVDEKFCLDKNLAKVLVPEPFIHHDWITNDIYKVPVIIIPGKNYKSFQLQIENLFTNPGLKPSMINVIFDRRYTAYADLAEINGVRSHSLINQQSSYPYFFKNAFEKAWSMYPYEKVLIFLEEDIIPTADFLSFINQCLTSDFMADGSLSGISAWTPYRTGYGLTKTWYRTSVFPGLGFLMKRSFYDGYLQGKMEICCIRRAWFGWTAADLGEQEFIFPNTPRVYRMPYEKPSSTPTYEDETSYKLFSSKNVVTEDFSIKLEQPTMISKTKYEMYLKQLVLQSIPFNMSSILPCLKDGSRVLPKESRHGSPSRQLSVFYEQINSTDYSLAFRIAKCFEFEVIQDVPVPNLRRGLLRISLKEDEIILIGSLTEHFKHKPSHADIIKEP